MTYSIVQTSWAISRTELSSIRRRVFIDEQRVPEADEWDEHDESSQHWLVYDNNGLAVATARLKPDGQIGRMAVLEAYRGQGVGAQLLHAVLDTAKQQLTTVYLHSQTHAIDFYKQFGFHTVGEEFMDAGIPHIEMRL